MRKLILLLLLPIVVFGQVKNVVKWTNSSKQVSDDEFILEFVATIDEGYHLYSQDLEEGGPLPTKFTFQNLENFELIGEVQEPVPESEFQEAFNMKVNYFSDKVVFTQRVKLIKFVKEIKAEVRFMACNDEECTPPLYKDISFDLVPESVVTQAESTQVSGSSSLLSIFITSFVGGLLALLTPCVFPMIPLTVSFFLKGGKKTNRQAISKALLYGLSIILIYVLLGTVISFIFGAAALNSLATDPWFNVAFFILLVIFAISFLGAFEIMLPNSWANKMDEKSSKGGFLGIFFMAFTLAIVSFSCTSPVVGTVLVQSAVSQEFSGPIVAMVGFSSALALPFTLFAIFPKWISTLPKSGSWLNTVKVTLGFLELAFAFKFLSNADLVLQLHLLERETFIAIWIAIFGLLTIYLLGFIQLPHDSKLEKLPVPRLFMAITTLFFTIYMIPGLWGAPLKILSGFPPPSNYKEWKDQKLLTSPLFNLGDKVTSKDVSYSSQKTGPHNLTVFTDYNEGLEYARKVNKPVFLDFTGYACVNCRKMEDNVWIDPRVLKLLSNEVVIVSLYVDDRKELPLDQQYISNYTDTKIKTVGGKWAEFQISRFKINAQPYYVFLNPKDENKLSEPATYVPNVETYLSWMERSINAYNR